MRHKSLSASLVLVALAGGLGLRPAAAQFGNDTPERIMKVLRDFAAGNADLQVALVGSAVLGPPRYKPGFSDGDIRLLVPAGMSDDAARAAWQGARRDLIGRIMEEFKPNGQAVLRKTNLYAPGQLMKGAQDLQDASRIFRDLGQVPNLGYSGPVNQLTPLSNFEGLYGEGALANIQFKELGEGRIFYKSGNKVFTGRLDLTHMAEGQGRWTIGGTANTAYQWAAHAADALKDKDARAVVKYLERLDADLMKGRNLARLTGDSPIQAQLRNLVARLRANPAGALNLFGDDIAAVLRKAQLEASLMRKLGGAGAIGQVMARALLEGRDGDGRLWKALSEASENVPAGLLIDGIFKAWMAHGALMSVADKDVLGAYNSALGMIPGLSLTPLLMAAIVSGTLEAARAGGYDLVASTQDAFELLSGIYTGVGRAGVDDRAYTIDELVKNLWTEEQLRCLVYARCVAAADRGFGNVTGRHDMGSAEAIFEKCFPVILRAWQSKRDMLALEYAEQCDQMAQDLLLIQYSPIPAVLKDGRAEVRLWPTTASNRQGERLERMRAILRLLLGPTAQIYANPHNTWTPAGHDLDQSDGSMAYTFTEPGKHIVKLEQRVAVGARNVPLKSPLVKDITRETAVEITVQEAGGGSGKPGAFAAVSTVPVNAFVIRSRNNRPFTFRLNGQIAADVPLTGGGGLGKGTDLTTYSSQSAWDSTLGAATCMVRPGKTAHVSVSVTPSGGGNYTSGDDQYSLRVKSVKLSLEEVSGGFPVSLAENVVTFTPRNRYDSAYVQLVVEIGCVRARDQAEVAEFPIKIFLLWVGGAT